MKRILFLSFLVLVATVSCNKAKQLANISVDIPYSTTIDLPSVPGVTGSVPLPQGGAELAFPAFAIATNSRQYLTQYHTSTNNIVAVDLKSLQLQLSNTADNFNFLDSIQVFLSAPTQPEVMVAWSGDIPQGTSTLNLTTNSGLNLKNYFIQDTIYIRMQAHVNALPPPNTQLTVSSIFHLTANPLD